MKNTIILAVLVACSLLVTCANPMSADNGVIGNGGGLVTVTIGDVGSRKIVKWANGLDSSELSYTITFSGGQGGPHSATIPPGGGTAIFSVAPGEWTISVEARYQNEVVAIGSQKKQINAGNNGNVTVMMGEPDAPFPDLTVNFESNGGTAVASKTAKKFNKVQKPAPDPTKSGLYFVDWFTDDITFQKPYDFNAPVMAAMTLYADWSATPPLVVTFDKNHNDASGWTDANPTTRNAVSGENVPLPAEPTRAGYTFNGWNTQANGSGITIIGSIHVTATITVYAQWRAVQGNGSSGNPFLVYDLDTLRKVGTGVDGWSLSAHYKQMEDINMPTDTWIPIGVYNSRPFTGGYDGNGKKISNLRINSSADYQGLFCVISGTVVNVVLENCNINGGQNVGGVAGQVQSGGKVQDCSVSGTVSGTYYIGGVVGRNSGTVQSCHGTGNVGTGSSALVGGVVGYNVGGTVDKCYYATGTVSGNQSIGGVLGDNNNGTVKDCYSTGTVSAGTDGWFVGGVVGNNESGTVQNCYSTSTVSAGTDGWFVGGVVGYIQDGTVQNCYSTGTVSAGTNGFGVGGVAGGSHGTLRNCVALNPSVSGTSDVGRVAGYTDGGTLANNYGWDGMTGGSWTSNPSGLDGADVSTSQYNDQTWWTTTSGLGWDFTNVWSWGGSLPVLRGMP